MADLLITRASKATTFLSISKGVAALSLSARTLLWNWMFGVRIGTRLRLSSCACSLRTYRWRYSRLSVTWASRVAKIGGRVLSVG